MPQGDYLGMTLTVLDLDNEILSYFQHCADHDFHLQQCADPDCALIRYPPGTACPWCSKREFNWVPVDARGEVHSYGEVHHAIQPAFRERAPYMILLVELDTQSGVPTEHEALRVAGNLVDADGNFAGPELVKQVGNGLPSWRRSECSASRARWRWSPAARRAWARKRRFVWHGRARQSPSLDYPTIREATMSSRRSLTLAGRPSTSARTCPAKPIATPRQKLPSTSSVGLISA
ncbi:MAG: hypothetical protein F4188_01750 [Chloroflexi bacterium]|nr:hypothetical protein [Chloroflexota bacterium]